MSNREARAALEWLIEMGADEALEETSRDRFRAPEARAEQASVPAASSQAQNSMTPAPPTARDGHRAQGMSAPGMSDAQPPVWHPGEQGPLQPAEAVLQNARDAAAAANDLESLHEAIRTFEGCELKRSASNTVIYRGSKSAKVMLIGEAPGRDEDIQGQPFVGAAGRMLDTMLESAGIAIEEVYITNILFWRPPGNRTPDTREIGLCLPFVERQIELIRPELLLMIGNVSVKTLLGTTQGITRLRGKWFAYQHEGLSAPIPAIASLHPAYLLRQPAQKRHAWRDMLAFRAVLRGETKPEIG
ncbi:uracil-DNA glycosylase [Fodinicurvata sediminis]|uniref:uracil-DNA glycosylase n=1 Tax=Fodinicurvata sediminis TaxID=1121832 RepID=UPI000408B94D|nr:uracil-DNA glycosylase [Fodinicurvata sediminis]